MHYIKLIYRSAFFFAAAAVYLYNRVKQTGAAFGGVEKRRGILIAVWLIFAVEMVLRFFPSRLESMGCQKQFAANFSARGSFPEPEHKKRQKDRSARRVAFAWVAFNAAIGALYFLRVIDRGILLLASLAFSVCDMICILFFCPFQVWFMKNKCCGTCRIYNWDYAMMFTPLIFIKSVYAWSLVAISLGLLLKWEILYRRHPERFSEAENSSLSCASCQEKLCRHKRSLRQFLKRQRIHFDHGDHRAKETGLNVADAAKLDLQ